jgi:uncharacterized protein
MTQTNIPTGRFVWFEYFVPDVKKSHGFYGELFNWTTQDVPMADGAYTMIAANGQTMAGYQTTPPGAPKSGHWLPHLQVENAAATAAQITKLGGKVRMEPKKLGDVGTVAVVADPLDGTFCLWQPQQHVGTGDWTQKAGSFCWVELQTQDPAKSLAFYKAVGGFGEQHSDGMPDYTVLTKDGGMRGGVNKPPMQAPQAWVPYVQVANCDASLDKAKKLGANVLVPAMEAKGVGRFAIFADPQGGVIGILQPG